MYIGTPRLEQARWSHRFGHGLAFEKKRGLKRGETAEETWTCFQRELVALSS